MLYNLKGLYNESQTPTTGKVQQLKKAPTGASLEVQWLRLCASDAVGTGSTLVRAIRSHTFHGPAKEKCG